MLTRGPVWVSKEQVLRAQEQALRLHGGLAGIRDEMLLESALAHPESLHAFGETSLLQLAAAYAVGIVRNHPFADGNKRAAYAASSLFLRLNGYALKVELEEEYIRVFLDIAEGRMSRQELAAFYETCAEAR